MEQLKARQLAESFKELHLPSKPLALFNVWDVASARAVAKSSPAVATSSAAVAASLGYGDGEQVPLEAVVRLVSAIASAVPVPVTVDLEAGYGDRPGEVGEAVARIVDAGAVGINIEDGLFQGRRELAAVSHHLSKIAAVREVASKVGIPLFINARTDPFLLKVGSPEECLDEAVRRAAQYHAAGADGIFVPGLTDVSLIAKLVELVDLPVNVMIMSPTISLATLAATGVSRVSLGPWPMMATMKAVEHAAAALVEAGEYAAPLSTGG